MGFVVIGRTGRHPDRNMAVSTPSNAGSCRGGAAHYTTARESTRPETAADFLERWQRGCIRLGRRARRSEFRSLHHADGGWQAVTDHESPGERMAAVLQSGWTAAILQPPVGEGFYI